MSRIKLLIVDDSSIHLEGLRLILRPYENIEVTGRAANPREAMEVMKENVPDVALLDISLEKDMDGIELAHAIKREYPAVKVIFLTHHKGTAYLVNALRSQPSAYLAKDLNPEELAATIMAVKDGKGVYFGETIPVSKIAEIFGSDENPARGRIYDISPRETEIIRLLSQGYSTKEISAQLGIEVNTVESHKERIKEKLGVNTVVQIVVSAIKKGIVTLED